MTNNGYIRICAASPRVHVAKPQANLHEMLHLHSMAEEQRADIIVFPELCITGITCGDLFRQKSLLEEAEKACLEYVSRTKSSRIISIFGCPLVVRGRLYNAAIVCKDGEINIASCSKHLEQGFERWFDTIDESCLASLSSRDNHFRFETTCSFNIGGKIIAVIIDPRQLDIKADIVINPTHNYFDYSQHNHKEKLIQALSSRNSNAIISCVAGYGESTQDYVLTSDSLIYECGELQAKGECFPAQTQILTADIDLDRLKSSNEIVCYQDYTIEPVMKDRLYHSLDPLPFLPKDKNYKLILDAQVAALCTRLEHIHCKKAVIGISGGLDSTLALIVTALAFDRLSLARDGIIGITMPGFGTSGRTKGNSDALLRLFGVESRCISIVDAVKQHFSDIGHAEDTFDTTFENAQARERTQILMDVAGMEAGLVVGTGDLSEIALGWCTYNGDHMSMYGVNAGVPKTLIRAMVTWAAENIFEGELSEVLMDIVDTPISPELVPTDENGKIVQKTESLVGPYELHDFFLYNMMRWGYSPEKLLFVASKAFEEIYDEQTIRFWLEKFLKRFSTQQFKRSCSPDGPKVGPVSLSPRGGWIMPSDLEAPFASLER